MLSETDELPYDAPNPVPKDLRDVDSTDGDYVCDICGKGPFKNDRGLALHKGKTHGSGSDKTPSQGRKKTKSTRELQQSLDVFFSSVGIAVTMANQVDGAAIINGTPGISSALANTAENNPKLRKMLESLTAGFAYSELIAASAVIIVPILANHNMLPERFGMAAAYLAAQGGGVDYSQAPQ
jgi:hypothetical protein